MYRVLLVLVFAVAVQAQNRAKNVILFLGDAGGIPTLNAASIYGYDEPRRLFIQSMPSIALSDTSAASSWVSDSAAGMTAIVTGRKTYNGVISQSTDAVRGQKDGEPLKTILEYAEERGLATGVVSNVQMADATLAACYAHANDRRKHGEIFLQAFSPRFGDGVDVIIGPGRPYILKAVEELGSDLQKVMRAKGFELYDSLDDIPAGARRTVVLFESIDFDHSAAALKALDILSRSSKGYFLMIEGDLHTDNPERGISRAVAFDKLIREIAGRVNPRDTLLLFTADHSFDLRLRGGRKGQPLLAPQANAQPPADKRSVRLQNIWVDGSHTGEEVLVAAQGPGAARVRGFLSNTDLFQIMMSAYGWKDALLSPVQL